MYGIDLSDVHIAILAGGSGTRLWPLSRQGLPKQFLRLLGEQSLLQRTYARVRPLAPPERIYVLTSPDYADAVAVQLPDLPRANILIEPSPKGTAPCLGLAAIQLRQKASPQSVMISVHADHSILQEEHFRQALVAAVAMARKGPLVTVGIVPSYPETGFGYIERGEALPATEGLSVYRVARFTEKPPLAQAAEFVASGRFCWNAGYFAWTLGNLLDEFQRQLPELYARLDAMVATGAGDNYARIWGQIAPVTIDVGIMEHAREAAVIPCDMGWSDVGGWAAMYDILPHDAQGNVILGEGEHIGVDTRNSLVYSQGRLVATVGLEGVVVIETPDAVLVLPRERAQDVSALVKELRARGRNALL